MKAPAFDKTGGFGSAVDTRSVDVDVDVDSDGEDIGGIDFFVSDGG